MKDIVIEAARPGDGAGIEALIKECFDEHQRSLFIYGCDGAANYIEDGVAYQDRGGDSAFIVARARRILAFIEVRRLADSVCLNNGATSSETRGQRTYRQLMAEAVELGAREGVTRAVHDVFVGNTIKNFHERIGYRVTDHFIWRSTQIRQGGDNRAAFVGLAQADAVHRRFGFSHVQVLTEQGRYDVGRLGSLWYRLGSADVLSDQAALGALHRLDPSRRLLVIASSSAQWPAGVPFEVEAESERLEGDVETVLSNLRGK